MKPRKQVVLYVHNEDRMFKLRFLLNTRLPVILYCYSSIEQMREHFESAIGPSTSLVIFDRDTNFSLKDLSLEGWIPAIEVGNDRSSDYHTDNFYVSRAENDWTRNLLETYKIAVQRKRGPRRMGSTPRHMRERTRRFPETMKVSPIINDQSLHQGLGAAS